MKNVLPFVGMVIVIWSQVGNMVVTKAAISREISIYVMIVYPDLLTTLILLPCIFVFERSPRLPLTSSVLCRIFLLAIIGQVVLLCRYIGLDYGSPTLDSAMINLVPAFAFILADGKIKLGGSTSSQVKIIGTLISIAGAFIVAFYKGPMIFRTQSLTAPIHLLVFSPRLKWITGSFFLATAAFMTALWYTLQAMVLKMFPSILTVCFCTSFFSTIVSVVYSLIMVADINAWMLRLDMRLVFILYSALVGNFLSVALYSWCLSKTRPLFVSMFDPFGIIFAVFIGVLFSGDALCLGSLIGAVVIVTGFYAVMWGKAKKEEKSGEDNGLGSSISSREKVPLLQKSV